MRVVRLYSVVEIVMMSGEVACSSLCAALWWVCRCFV